jgi:hypothetical protein
MSLSSVSRSLVSKEGKTYIKYEMSLPESTSKKTKTSFAKSRISILIDTEKNASQLHEVTGSIETKAAIGSTKTPLSYTISGTTAENPSGNIMSIKYSIDGATGT